jgi:hypothetical protein
MMKESNPSRKQAEKTTKSKVAFASFVGVDLHKCSVTLKAGAKRTKNAWEFRPTPPAPTNNIVRNTCDASIIRRLVESVTATGLHSARRTHRGIETAMSGDCEEMNPAAPWRCLRYG